MNARQPWLRGGGVLTVPFGDALRKTDVEPNRGPWRTVAEPQTQTETVAVAVADTDTATANGRCGGCAALRESVEASRAEAIEHGQREGLEQTATTRARLDAVIAATDQVRTARVDAMIEQVVDLALGLCAELAPAAAAIDRRGLVQLVARSLADAGGSRDLMLQVCAEDAAVMGTQLPAGMVCTVRPELVPGEVWIEAPRLVVDGRWATRLAALREPLIALVRAAEPAFELATPMPPPTGADDAV